MKKLRISIYPSTRTKKDIPKVLAVNDIGVAKRQEGINEIVNHLTVKEKENILMSANILLNKTFAGKTFKCFHCQFYLTRAEKQDSKKAKITGFHEEKKHFLIIMIASLLNVFIVLTSVYVCLKKRNVKCTAIPNTESEAMIQP